MNIVNDYLWDSAPAGIGAPFQGQPPFPKVRTNLGRRFGSTDRANLEKIPCSTQSDRQIRAKV